MSRWKRSRASRSASRSWSRRPFPSSARARNWSPSWIVLVRGRPGGSASTGARRPRSCGSRRRSTDALTLDWLTRFEGRAARMKRPLNRRKSTGFSLRNNLVTRLARRSGSVFRRWKCPNSHRAAAHDGRSKTGGLIMHPVRPWLAGLVFAGLVGVLLLTPAARAGDVGYVEDFALAKDRADRPQATHPRHRGLLLLPLPALPQHRAVRQGRRRSPGRGSSGTARPPGSPRSRPATPCSPTSKNPRRRSTTSATASGCTSTTRRRRSAPPRTCRPPSTRSSSPATRSRPTRSRGGATSTTSRTRPSTGSPPRTSTGSSAGTCSSGSSGPTSPNLPKLVADDLDAPSTPRPFGAFPIHAQLTLAAARRAAQAAARRCSTRQLRQRLRHQAAARRRRRLEARPQARRARTSNGCRRSSTGSPRSTTRSRPTSCSTASPSTAPRACTTRPGSWRTSSCRGTSRTWPRRGTTAPSRSSYPADLNADYSAGHAAAAVGADEPLVRSYLKHFFVEDDGDQGVRAVHRRRLPEAPVRRDEDRERASATPRRGRRSCRRSCSAQLKDRIDIDFAFTNKTDFAADEPVKLDLFVKNVPTLLVKVFEINTAQLSTARTLREVDTDINLDGLVANASRSHKYDDPPLRRRRPARSSSRELNKPGVYVDRLHRRRQEQPGADPQGPAAAARRHRHGRAERHASWTSRTGR